MTKQDKRYPAFEDNDLMPFGKHHGESLSDVPARYLVWLWNDGLKDEYGRHNCWAEDLVDWMKDRVKLANYIWNCKEALAQETGEIL